MQNKLAIAEVNCEDYNRFCKQQGVEGFPQLFLYSGGKKLEYTGARAIEPLEKYAMKAATPYVLPSCLFDALRVLNLSRCIGLLSLSCIRSSRPF